MRENSSSHRGHTNMTSTKRGEEFTEFYTFLDDAEGDGEFENLDVLFLVSTLIKMQATKIECKMEA